LYLSEPKHIDTDKKKVSDHSSAEVSFYEEVVHIGDDKVLSVEE